MRHGSRESRVSACWCGALLGLLWAGACGAEDGDYGDEGEYVADVDASECSTERKWVGGDEDSPWMRPGGDCIGCHLSRGEGPVFAAAGTVHATIDEPDDCFGVQGVTVEITDADGMVFSAMTNEAGNFWFGPRAEPFAIPISAKLRYEGRERMMVAMQSTGACQSCHTPTGANQAPGRILAP